MTYWDYQPLGLWIDLLRRDTFREINYEPVGPPERVPLFWSCTPSATLQRWTYSPAGLLCVVFREQYTNANFASYFGEGAFHWAEMVDRQVTYYESCWADEMPGPLIKWWNKSHVTLPFSKLRPFLTDPHLSFKRFADLLEMHAPWA